ncbi:MAG: class I SAM-dependent methyltransferase [Chloroflexota bacterium]
MNAIDQHNQLIQKEFTKQARAYASNPNIKDTDWAMTLVNAVQPVGKERVLEVATGPGYVALAFATRSKEVIGLDLTDAPLAIARQNQAERGITNVSFQAGDANQLPFEDNEFDVVVCRLAVHHFADPRRVLSEMVRVCKPGGKLAVEDLIASEHSQKAYFYNYWERLRDPSHVTALSLSQLLALYTGLGLEAEYVHTQDKRQVVEQWMKNSQTPLDVAEEIRTLLERDKVERLSGIPVYTTEEGELCFDHRMIVVIGRK